MMNSLWPAASRLSCIQPRVISQTCHTLDNLAAKLAQRSIRSYSTSPSPLRSRGTIVARAPLLRKSCLDFSLPSLAGRRGYATRRIITQFEDLPEDYEDQEGLEFRAKPLSDAETFKIFGKDIDASTANTILSILHGRRVAGTLADPDIPLFIPAYEKIAQTTAMEWLRENVPVDEVQNAGLRAEQELAELEGDIVANSTRVGLYRPNSQNLNTGKGMFTQGKQSIYGDSVLDRLRDANKARDALEEEEKKKREAQAAEIAQTSGTLEPVGATGKVELQSKSQSHWVKYYTERAKLSESESPPEMTKFQRLFPSSIFVLFILGLCFTLPFLYTPPRNKDRMFPDLPPAAATVLGIVGANLVIYMLWHFPPFWRIGNKYFMTSAGLPNALSLLGNTFSHQTLKHFGANMLVLFIVGTRLHDEVGRANFLSIYLGTGVLASLTSLTSYVVRNSFVSCTLGASGAVAGVIGAYLWLRRDQPMRIFFMPEDTKFYIPAWFPLFIIIAMEIGAMSKWNKTPITMDHWAHIGGYFSGMGAAEILRMRRNMRQRRENERKKNMSFTDRIKEGRL